MSQKVLWWGSITVAVIATLAPDLFAYYALVLLVIGLVDGFMNPMEDFATRVGYYVLAALLPAIADNLDVIPTVGAPLNDLLDNFAVAIAGTAIANFCVAVFKGLTAAGDD